MKRFISFSFYLFLAISIFAQQVMHLGSTSFVKPSAKMSVVQRSISVRTAVRGARVFAKVGGIAFIQEATPAPDFSYSSISLSCNPSSQLCSVNVDNKSYNIPLSTWMLQPIVNFANDTCNAVVTLYGEDDAKIMYHPAFVDKLLGLRLLQTDMMLAGNRLKTEDRGCIPEDENNNPIIANSEKTVYYNIDKEQQQNAIKKLSLDLLKDMVEYGSWDTYIYTDRDQKIQFSIKDGNFTISGEPYYLFSERFFNQIDTTSFIDQSNFYKEISEYYNKEYEKLANINSKLKVGQNRRRLLNIDEKNISDYSNNDLISLYLKRDTASVINYNHIISTTYKNLTTTIDEIFKTNNNFKNSDGDVALVMKKVRDYKETMGWLSLPFIKAWADLLTDLHPESNAGKKLSNAISNYYYNDKSTFLNYMSLCSLPYTEERTKLSDMIKMDSMTMKTMNPLVYNAAIATCQWSAFFRYMKKHNPTNWKMFVQKVNKLTYNAPSTWTPVDCSFVEN